MDRPRGPAGLGTSRAITGCVVPLLVAKKALTISTRLALWTVLPLGSNVDDYLVGFQMLGRRFTDAGAAALSAIPLYPK